MLPAGFFLAQTRPNGNFVAIRSDGTVSEVAPSSETWLPEILARHVRSQLAWLRIFGVMLAFVATLTVPCNTCHALPTPHSSCDHTDTRQHGHSRSDCCQIDGSSVEIHPRLAAQAPILAVAASCRVNPISATLAGDPLPTPNSTAQAGRSGASRTILIV